MLYDNLYQYIFYPGTAIVVFFGIMVFLLTFGAFSGGVYNMTTNEISKQKKYEYLKVSENGNKLTIFDKGWVYNLKYYFHLVEPPDLETEFYEIPRDYTV